MLVTFLIFVVAQVAAVVGLGIVAARRSVLASPRVDLGYATYDGIRLGAGVDQYLGMRYAKAPLGDLRFRAPQDPDPVSGAQSASAFGPVCVGGGQNPSAGLAEDCLFVNVFSPSNATEASKLPVWVYIQGGGYKTNSNNDYNGTGVVKESGYNLILVNFNYRVGSLGYLASEKVRKNGDLNAGLLDQRKLLQWVQKHIHKFGGDPEHVVIHGASAGGGSVTHHLAAYGGRDDGLFVGAVPESPFWPTQRTVAEMEFQFEHYVRDAGCADRGEPVACLRSQSLQTLLDADTVYPFPEANGSTPLPIWYWLPVVDGDLVPDGQYALFEKGKFVRVPMLVGHDTNEGTYFAYNASTSTEMAAFLDSNYPRLSPDQLHDIADAYPATLTTPLPNHAAYFPATEAAYGEATFTCPAAHLARVVSQHVATPARAWMYRYNVIDAQNVAGGLGVPHTFETSAIFGVGNAGSAAASYSGANAAIVPVTMGYFISFVRSLNPNTFRAPGAPLWEAWSEGGAGGGGGGGGGWRMRLETNATAMEPVPEDLVKRCELWRRLAGTTEM